MTFLELLVFPCEERVWMALVPITSLSDERLTPYRQLKATNDTRGRSFFVVEGAKLVERLIESRHPVVSVVATERRVHTIAELVPADVPLYVIPNALADVLVGFNFHQGVLACGRRGNPPALEAVLDAAADPITLVACPRLDNPENFGSILRLADVFGVPAVLVGAGCPDPFSRRVLRVSMGMALRVPVIAAPDLPGALRGLHDRWGFDRVAAVADPAATPLDRYRRRERVVLLLGRESSGLEDAWLEGCEHRLVIPMRPGAESLNVGVAAGILLYHLTSRAGGPGGDSGTGFRG